MISGFRLALRTLWRNPVPTCVIVLTLAVAIGVSTIIASTVDSVWHALPVADTDRLVFVSSTDPRPGEARAGMVGDVAITGTSVPDLTDWMARSTTLDCHRRARIVLSASAPGQSRRPGHRAASGIEHL